MKDESSSRIVFRTKGSIPGPVVAAEMGEPFSGIADDIPEAVELKPTRILVLDDQQVIREGLCMLLETQDDLRVTSQAGDFLEALKTTKTEKPDVVLLDPDAWGAKMVDRIPELILASKGTRVIVLTSAHDTALHRRVVRLGAMGLVLKDQASGVLFKAIRKVSAGEAWIDRSLTASLLREMSGLNNGSASDPEAAQIATLTPREREVIAVLCNGCNNKQIADRLFISEMTVRNHVTSILAKLGLSDRFELAIYCYRHGIAKPPI